MIKINPYNDNTFEFYKEVVKSKRNTEKKPNLKEELKNLEISQARSFETYDAAFQSNSLASINGEPYVDDDKENLKGLYSYKSKKIQQLKSALSAHPINPENLLNTCQNCTINEVNSMDHVRGQTGFPEFSVHPKNLFPCCTVCNGKKSDRFTGHDGLPIFLNLYLDELPESQYLFVDFGENWLPRYYLEKPEDVSEEQYKRIVSHYEELDLLNRFRDSSNVPISTLRATIRAFGDNDLENKINAMCDDLGPVLGYNHRQIILYRALGSCNEFIEECRH